MAGAKVITYWFDAPLWLLSLILMLLMTGTNLISVASFGAFEYWFAGIKVATIVTFLVLGTFFVFGLWPGQDMDFEQSDRAPASSSRSAWAQSSPHVVVIFSMVGAEIATIAAAESPDPRRR